MNRYFNPVTKAILTRNQLRAAYPNTIFPSPFEPPAGWFEVQATPKPTIDELSAYLMEGEPALQGQIYVEVWIPTSYSPEVYLQRLSARKAEAVKSIDASVDAIYAEALGGRAIEYQRAEREALEYQAAGFTGEAPSFVASWAAASGLSQQAAAENILAQANSWNTAAAAIRAARLSSKQQVLNAASSTALTEVMDGWESFLLTIRTTLGFST